MSTTAEIGPFHDLPMALTVELDRKVLKLRDILDWEPGTIVKMTRSAGENIDILVGGAILGFGEIVILEDAMGVRITDFALED